MNECVPFRCEWKASIKWSRIVLREMQQDRTTRPTKHTSFLIFDSTSNKLYLSYIFKVHPIFVMIITLQQLNCWSLRCCSCLGCPYFARSRYLFALCKRSDSNLCFYPSLCQWRWFLYQLDRLSVWIFCMGNELVESISILCLKSMNFAGQGHHNWYKCSILLFLGLWRFIWVFS